MAFKILSSTSSSIKDPETLFRDLRSRTVEGLMAQQADMLRSYMNKVDETDLALELPTGSGKTLVGLLIAEWRRRANKERCVFLCPTKQLVHQVVEQAREKYGIQALDFAGSKKEYSERDKSSFMNCEAIGVATYSSLFNTNSFFNDVSTIIFDDAHAAENYVSSFWSLEISRRDSDSFFSAIWGLIKRFLPENDQLRYDETDELSIDYSFVNKLPAPFLWDIKSELMVLLDNYCQNGDHYFQWKMIRENLHACHLYYTNYSILIRPIIAPTQSFAPFSNAKQRIYMSATLGEGGDLERIFGQKSITHIPAPVGWDKQGIGRRFFVFPMRLCSEDCSLYNAITWIQKFGRTLILTPRNFVADKTKDLIREILKGKSYQIFSSEELETSKKSFIETEKAIAILANRYDGIDLIGDECRYLIVQDLPEATNLQERFLITRLGSAILFKVRIRTRITQAVGRCTRSATDYALVVILGEKLNNYFLKPENRCHLHPELQAEVEFGIEQSKVTNVKELEDNIDIFCSQNVEWKNADSSILEMRDKLSQSAISSTDALAKIVSCEIRYQNFLWNQHFAEALDAAKDVLAELNGDELQGYRALWNYLAGNAAFFASRTNIQYEKVAKEHYIAAAKAVNALPWLKHLQSLFLAKQSSTEDMHGIGEIIENVEMILDRLGTTSSKNIENYFSNIRTGLSSSGNAKTFENAQVMLGKLLGYHASNSDDQGAPDPWWIFGNQGIVFEDYTDTGENPVISKDKVLQASGHQNWLRQYYPQVSFTTVFCSTSNKLHDAAIPQVDGIYYISVNDFVLFSEKVMSVVRELWRNYSEPGNLNWRQAASNKLLEVELAPYQLLSFFTKNKLASLIRE